MACSVNFCVRCCFWLLFDLFSHLNGLIYLSRAALLFKFEHLEGAMQYMGNRGMCHLEAYLSIAINPGWFLLSHNHFNNFDPLVLVLFCPRPLLSFCSLTILSTTVSVVSYQKSQSIMVSCHLTSSFPELGLFLLREGPSNIPCCV